MRKGYMLILFVLGSRGLESYFEYLISKCLAVPTGNIVLGSCEPLFHIFVN